jgi:hypothetical protein
VCLSNFLRRCEQKAGRNASLFDSIKIIKEKSRATYLLNVPASSDYLGYQALIF